MTKFPTSLALIALVIASFIAAQGEAATNCKETFTTAPKNGSTSGQAMCDQQRRPHLFVDTTKNCKKATCALDDYKKDGACCSVRQPCEAGRKAKSKKCGSKLSAITGAYCKGAACTDTELQQEGKCCEATANAKQAVCSSDITLEGSCPTGFAFKATGVCGSTKCKESDYQGNSPNCCSKSVLSEAKIQSEKALLKTLKDKVKGLEAKLLTAAPGQSAKGKVIWASGKPATGYLVDEKTAVQAAEKEHDEQEKKKKVAELCKSHEKCRTAQMALYDTYRNYANHLSQATHVEIAQHVAELRLLINEMETAKVNVESRQQSMTPARQKVMKSRIDNFVSTIKTIKQDLAVEIQLKAEFENDSENVVPKLQLLSACMDLPVAKQAEEIRKNEIDTASTMEEFKKKLHALHASLKSSVKTFSTELTDHSKAMAIDITESETQTKAQDKEINKQIGEIKTRVEEIHKLEKLAKVNFETSYKHLLRLAGDHNKINIKAASTKKELGVELLQTGQNAHKHIESIAHSRKAIKTSQAAIRKSVTQLDKAIEKESDSLQSALLIMMGVLNGFRDKTKALKTIMDSKIERTEDDQGRLFASLQTTIASIVDEMDTSVRDLTVTQRNVNGLTASDLAKAEAACKDGNGKKTIGGSCTYTSPTTGKSFNKCVLVQSGTDKNGQPTKVLMCNGHKSEIAADVLLEPFKEAPPVDAPPPMEDSLEDEQLVKPDEIVVEDGKK